MAQAFSKRTDICPNYNKTKNIKQCLIDKDILNYEFYDEVDNDECFITFDYCLN